MSLSTYVRALFLLLVVVIGIVVFARAEVKGPKR